MENLSLPCPHPSFKGYTAKPEDLFSTALRKENQVLFDPELLQRGQMESPRHRLLELRNSRLPGLPRALSTVLPVTPGEQLQDRTLLGWCTRPAHEAELCRDRGCTSTSLWVQASSRLSFQAFSSVACFALVSLDFIFCRRWPSWMFHRLFQQVLTKEFIFCHGVGL